MTVYNSTRTKIKKHGSNPVKRLPCGNPRLLPNNSSCGSSEYSGEVIPHHPGLPKSDPGHWWASFFFGKTTHPAMTTVSESPENSGTFRVANGVITCGLAEEVMRKRHASEPSKPNSGPSA
ncbi:UNVERIFIED_CONTAM: hypothetical protein K2H54_070619 [Gekko kuhli]